MSECQPLGGGAAALQAHAWQLDEMMMSVVESAELAELHGRALMRDRAMLTCYPGEAVQVDPIKPKFTAPGTRRLKLKYDLLLSKLAFNFNLCRYTRGQRRRRRDAGSRPGESSMSVMPTRTPPPPHRRPKETEMVVEMEMGKKVARGTRGTATPRTGATRSAC